MNTERWIIVLLLAAGVGGVWWLVATSPGGPVVGPPLSATLQPLPPTPDPTTIVERNGAMTIADIRAVGLLVSAVYTVTGDIVRQETYLGGPDEVGYHVAHLVAAGVDLGQLRDDDVTITRLPSGGQRIAVTLPPAETFFVEPSARAGVVYQDRPVLARVLGVFLPDMSALVNVATSDAQTIARQAALDHGILAAAADVAAQQLARILLLAGFEEAHVIGRVQ